MPIKARPRDSRPARAEAWRGPAQSALTWIGLDSVPEGWGPTVVTMGVFDGVHRGHARLIERAVRLGRQSGLPVVLTTFDPHPASVVGQRRDTSLLTTLERRAALATELGCAAVLVLPFDQVMAQTSPEDFAATVFDKALSARAVLVGAGFRFGHRGAGDIARLKDLGAYHGFAAHEIELRPGCSSTRVRELLGKGDVRGAARVLGRPHRASVCGKPECHCVPEKLPAPGTYVVDVDGVRRGTATIGKEGGISLDGRTVVAVPATVDFIARASSP